MRDVNKIDVKAETQRFFKNETHREKKFQGAGIRFQKRQLGLAREELSELQSEVCPYGSNDVMENVAFQWQLDHDRKIENCKTRIAVIKAKMKEMTQKRK